MTLVHRKTRTGNSTPVSAPRTWSFIDRKTGETVEYTCMQGCTLDHSHEMGRPVFREDVWCWFWDQPLTLPVNENGSPEEFRVLSTVVKVEPWAPQVAHRLPFAVIELVDDHFIDGLDPDGLETVISTLSERLEQMRATHRRLVEARKAYRERAV
ncbi:2-oxo-4-hydroxy-4-carboxy-5-ureidoimidazoline decarboxylase [Streptomyces sp. NRRL F-4707]|uniref:2-oxo-4-hydroxy-4-carboxy-5-ureidoimidazoline decarboxylase n=1 Tax=Streptomyces sp. NRRL F-4707 TaxID=1519496 RepID=UPI001F3E485F|nr:2-oxo-4-hydroxy-4-carboxy-5-ureidoimidazoline decarboxylase [Streptomyces sp. NRRL F-4707]